MVIADTSTLAYFTPAGNASKLQADLRPRPHPPSIRRMLQKSELNFFNSFVLLLWALRPQHNLGGQGVIAGDQKINVRHATFEEMQKRYFIATKHL